jgi:hypothetical protein
MLALNCDVLLEAIQVMTLDYLVLSSVSHPKVWGPHTWFVLVWFGSFLLTRVQNPNQGPKRGAANSRPRSRCAAGLACTALNLSRHLSCFLRISSFQIDFFAGSEGK